MSAATSTQLYTLHHNTRPTASEYLHLRTTSGLTPPPHAPSDLSRALENSVAVIVAREGESSKGKAIGMARAVGDGVVFVYINDVCVEPAWQGRGVGTALVKAMMAHLDKIAPQAYVSLEADPPGVRVYERAGFTVPAGKLMVRSVW